jgi:hypothetical protein
MEDFVANVLDAAEPRLTSFCRQCRPRYPVELVIMSMGRHTLDGVMNEIMAACRCGSRADSACPLGSGAARRPPLSCGPMCAAGREGCADDCTFRQYHMVDEKLLMLVRLHDEDVAMMAAAAAVDTDASAAGTRAQGKPQRRRRGSKRR